MNSKNPVFDRVLARKCIYTNWKCSKQGFIFIQWYNHSSSLSTIFCHLANKFQRRIDKIHLVLSKISGDSILKIIHPKFLSLKSVVAIAVNEIPRVQYGGWGSITYPPVKTENGYFKNNYPVCYYFNKRMFMYVLYFLTACIPVYTWYSLPPR